MSTFSFPPEGIFSIGIVKSLCSFLRVTSVKPKIHRVGIFLAMIASRMKIISQQIARPVGALRNLF
jgi:hypothetical protein